MKSASWMNPIKARNLSESIKHVDGYCWNAFQRDYAQIVHSDFFKRLSGKTQVHSFPLNDHLRTRLTHSIEASQIGRQISRYFCKKLNDKGMFEKNTRHYDDFSNRLEELTGAACLLHDIGHPPFGHVGTHLLNKLSHKFSEEFDDNKQAFRISLSKVWHEKFDPSAPLIAAIMKKNEVDKVAYKTEHVSLKNLLFHLKIPDLRHPASFFMEAADDIAYIAADFSDYLQYFVDYSQFQKMLSHSDINKLNTITVLKNDFSEDDKNLFGKLTEIYNTNFEKSGEAILEFSTSLIKNLLANVFDSIDVFMNNNEFSSLDEIPSKLKNFTIEHATQKDTNLLYLKCTKYGELFYNLKKRDILNLYWISLILARRI